MKIAILGTRGIPNHYGGFEQFAAYFAVYAASKNHDVTVYNSSLHPYKEKTYNGVSIIHCFDPEDKIGTAGQFIYDLNCILDTRKKNYDIILQLGYTSSAIWFGLHPKNAIVITNMDGLEWKRTKYSKPIQKLLLFSEKIAVNKSNFLVADSIGIQNYISTKYNKPSTYIAYGTDNFKNPSAAILDSYGLEQYQYNMIMARFEPENNIEMVLEAVAKANEEKYIIVVGNHNTKFGTYLKNKFQNCSKIMFLGAIYNQNHLDNLRYFSNIYFHGHTVGGTNPSLLEAMASKALIAAHNNEFNRGILNENAFYFKNVTEAITIIETITKEHYTTQITTNYEKTANQFNWKTINESYLQLFEKCLDSNSNRKQRK